VRRAGVTTALQHLNLLGLTEAKRGRIVIRDRTGLERFAGDIIPRARSRDAPSHRLERPARKPAVQ
jgi:hypothetical protein